ncbi:MAG: flagellar assembly protein T N-terminal domain-containing protein [Oleiphilaceae bacterium]|nr:flagellar assembly protein T N-terminal domain-containing protein [Oleiphilaceae bacterium]
MSTQISSFFFTLLLTTLVQADWIQVEGSASLNDLPYELARERAREAALQEAVMQYGTEVRSRQRMENGVLKHDQVEIHSQARVSRAVVQEEYHRDGKVHLVMNVEVEAVPQCPNSQSSHYKKKVAVLGFTVQTPQQAQIGQIHDVDRELASALNHALHRSGGVVVYESSDLKLYREMRNAPSHYTAQNTLTKAADLAKQMGAQFVVSGVVRNLGVEDEAAFKNSYWQRLANFAKNSNRTRHFEVELFVHDGFSGAIVWQRTFHTSGQWRAEVNRKLSMSHPEFWEDGYGQAVRRLIDDMALKIEEQLRCQPFMTRISRVAGKTLHFDSGASTGIRPGDKLALYRTFNFHDADQLKGVELTNVKTALTVSQVHPGFASGTISVDPTRLNIQEDDLLIAW